MIKLLKNMCSGVFLTGLVLACATSVQAGVVVMGTNSGVTRLSQAQVAGIYLGKVRDLPSGGVAITAITANGSVKDDFLDKVLGRTEQQARATWARLMFTGGGSGPKEIGSASDMKKLVATNPNVIGTLDKADVDATVKIVFEP